MHHVVSQKAQVVHKEKMQKLHEAHAAAGYPDHCQNQLLNTISMYRLGGNFYQQALESLSCCQPVDNVPDQICEVHGLKGANDSKLSSDPSKINDTMISSGVKG